MPVYAVTGMICSGKSTLLRELKKKGALIYDSDRVVHGFYRDPDNCVCRKVGNMFPETVAENKTIVRSLLAEIVLKDRAKLAALEQIIHPAVLADLKAWIDKRRGIKNIFLAEVPLLFEKDLDRWFDAVVFVSAPEEVLIERLTKRSSLSRAEAKQRLELMAEAGEKKKKSQFILNNDSDRKKLKIRIDRLWEQLLSYK